MFSPQSIRYWPDIDDALREAAFGRRVAVRLLVSCGRDTNPAMLPFLQSLEAMHYPARHISVEVVRGERPRFGLVSLIHSSFLQGCWPDYCG